MRDKKWRKIMLRQNEVEEIIKLIHSGFNLQLLSFELDIPMEQIQICNERLELRKFAKEAIKNGKADLAIQKLNEYIESTEDNLVERLMLLKINAYVDKTIVKEEEIQEIEDDKKRLGFSKNIDEILNELGLQIPKRKTCNIRKNKSQYEANIERRTSC